MTSIRLLAPTSNFGFDMLRKQVAEKKGENVFISPLSLSVALAMTANGTAGETFAGMSKALGLPDYGDQGKTNSLSYANLITALTGGDLGVTMKIANSIWAADRKDVSFSEAFLKGSMEHFKAQVNKENFADPATVAKINTWVSDNTEKKIDKIIDSIDPDTVMFLMNAVYFKGDFQVKFDKAATHDAAFKAASGDVTAKMMFRNDNINYGDTEDYQMVALPFGEANKRFSLFVLLPRDGKSVEDVVNGLTGPSFFETCKDMYKPEINLYLPKFEVEYEANMNQSLIDQGMGDAFDGSKADFSRLVDSAAGNLFISRVKHKVYARVDEEGAEAAAVTSVEVGIECASPPPMNFRVDRPFVAMIADEDTGTVAFAGVINNPEAPKA